MLELLLQNLGFDVTEYEIKSTKKDIAYYSKDGEFELITNGCTTACWSNIYPYLVISKVELKKIKKVSNNKIIREYKDLLFDYVDDLRKCKFNSYELNNLELLFSFETKQLIVNVFKDLVKIRNSKKRELFLENK